MRQWTVDAFASAPFKGNPACVVEPFDAWPDDLKRAMQRAAAEAVTFQRKLAEEEHEQSRKIIEDAGCEIVELDAKEHAAFVAAVQPLLADGRTMYGEAMFKMVAKV